MHGGGFYHPQKYLVAPTTLPEHLHWFYWESYSTWLSGFALFAVLVPVERRHVPDRQARARLVAGGGDRAWRSRSSSCSGSLYDAICRAVRRSAPGGDAIVGALVAGAGRRRVVAGVPLFAGRAAFLLVGAMIARR